MPRPQTTEQGTNPDRRRTRRPKSRKPKRVASLERDSPIQVQNMKLRKNLFSIHKWLGLFGALWLAILGISGLILDHRDDWRWAWQFGVSNRILPDDTVQRLAERHVTLLQANPQDAQQWVAGGAAGLWHSFDGTSSWQRVSFEGATDSPMVFGILLDLALGWKRIWLATDDGLWRFDPSQTPALAIRAGLAGRHLTALDNGAHANTLVAVEDRSRILLISLTDPLALEILDLEATWVSGLPEEVTWSRFIFDTHLGRSFVRRDINLLINDFGALLFVLLALTGTLQWWYRRNQARQRRLLVNSLFNLHAPVFGLLAIIPVIYLSLTGIVMDHRDQWIPTLVSHTIDRDTLPSVYDFGSLRQEVSHLVAYPKEASKFTIGTRLGVLTSEDKGQSWRREQGASASPGFVWSLKRMGDQLFAGGLGGPSFHRPLAGGDWQMIPGLVGMPSDATLSQDDWFVISGAAMFHGGPTTGMKRTRIELPKLAATPLMLLMFEIHSGRIISKHARYFLDLLAVLAIVMVVTGPILWWRRKWARTPSHTARQTLAEN